MIHDMPTTEELARVARHWQRVKALACEHETIRCTWGDPPTCDSCDRPISILSDLQIENIRERGSGVGG